VLYGFESAVDKEVLITIATRNGELIASVSDDGREFNPLEVKTPDLNATLAERDLGGLGIHLVRSLMDHVTYQREGAKNVLTVRKRIR